MCAASAERAAVAQCANAEGMADEFFRFGTKARPAARTPARTGSPPPQQPSPPPPSPPLPPPSANHTQNVDRLRKLLAPPTPRSKAELPDGAAFLVWDTETSGLTADAVVVQLAWAICSEAGTVLRRYDRLWRLPPRRTISWGARKIHGISTRRVAAQGYTAATELRTFVALVRAMRTHKLRVVAHNAPFDVRMLKQTARAHGVDDADVEALDTRDFFCTMAAARDNCGLHNRAGRKRNPSNAELYQRLIGKAPEGPLHDAFADIMVTAASYVAGKLKKWW